MATGRRSGGLLFATIGFLLAVALPVSASVLVWSALLGGAEPDGAAAMAADGRGALLIAGRTDSPDFPGAGYGGRDAFVAKYDERSGSLAWVRRLGGEGSDEAFAVTAGRAGELFVAGATDSRSFPDGERHGPGGGRDLFAVRLAGAGGAPVWAVRIGGSGFETACPRLLLADGGDLFLAGFTASPDFPSTRGASGERYCGGAMDAFVLKLSGRDGRLLWCRFLGGSGADFALALAPGGDGDLLIGGATQSADFPASPGACDRKLSGNGDAFVAKLSGDGRILWSTFLGGAEDGAEETRALAIGRDGGALVAGFTAAADFPTTAGAFGRNYSGGGDIFLAELGADRGGLVWSSLLGGGGADDAYDLAVDDRGSLIVAGSSASLDFPAPPGSAGGAHGGGECDAVLAIVSPDGEHLLGSAFLGGEGEEMAFAAQAGSGGTIYLAGETLGDDFPVRHGKIRRGGRGDAWLCALRPAGEVSP